MCFPNTLNERCNKNYMCAYHRPENSGFVTARKQPESTGFVTMTAQ